MPVTAWAENIEEMDTIVETSLAEQRHPSASITPSTIERLFLFGLRRLRHGSLRVVLPSGAVAMLGDRQQPILELRILNAAFFGKVFASGSVGFGESYVDGDWETDDLTSLLHLLARNQSATGRIQRGLSWFAKQLNRMHHRARRNTVDQSKANIQEHYDLSNEFYGLFLDSSMTYSSGLFSDYYESLEQAQANKINRMLDLADVKSGDRILEIGSGWGALALAAARRGVHVTTITLSQEQYDYAADLFRREGVEDLVEIRLQDYRNLEGRTYDAVVSCEMIEAVGKEYLPSYFETISRSLKPQGKAVIQAITIPDERYANYCKSCDWIQKHIFPGGHLPSPRAIDESVKNVGEIRVSSSHGFGKDYAETLNRWAKAFNRNASRVSELGFDETFQRKWNYYFSYCSAGFEANLIDVKHIVISGH